MLFNKWAVIDQDVEQRADCGIFPCYAMCMCGYHFTADGRYELVVGYTTYSSVDFAHNRSPAGPPPQAFANTADSNLRRKAIFQSLHIHQSAQLVGPLQNKAIMLGRERKEKMLY